MREIVDTWREFRRAEMWLNTCKALGDVEDIRKAREDLARARRKHVEAILRDAETREAEANYGVEAAERVAG